MQFPLPAARAYGFLPTKVNVFLTPRSMLRINESEAQRNLVGKEVIPVVANVDAQQVPALVR